MRSTIAALAILGTLAACDIPVKKAPPAEQGLGAGATPTTATPAPTPIVDSTAQPAIQPSTPVSTPAKATAAKKPARTTDQTQSGVTDAKTGASTLGENIRKARPDQDQPVTAKGDVVVARWDSSQGGWTYKKLGDTTAMVRAPGAMKGDSAFNQQKGDSLKPVAPPTTPVVPTDTTIGPLKGDTALKRMQPDSLKVQGNDTMPMVPAPAPMPIPIPAPSPAPKDSVKP